MDKITVATHNGKFHADEVFAAAVLQLFYKNQAELEINRTRDSEIYTKTDFCLDLGREYDPETKRFDHHQEDGAGERENGVPYATAGLIWKHYGRALCENNEKVWLKIDEDLFQIIDAGDNGYDEFVSKSGKLKPFGVNTVINVFNPTWQEGSEIEDIHFTEAVAVARRIIERKISHVMGAVEAEDLVKGAYGKAEDKRIIVLPQFYPWKEVLSQKDEPLFVIYPGPNNDYRVEAVPVEDAEGFERRILFPEGWRGKEVNELAQVSGVEEAFFCHRAGFLSATRTLESAIELTRRALELNSR